MANLGTMNTPNATTLGPAVDLYTICMTLLTYGVIGAPLIAETSVVSTGQLYPN